MCLTLTSIIRTGLPILVELIHLLNSNDLTQMVTFPTWIPDCDSHNPAILDLFISSDASICSTMALPPLGNSDHVVVSVSIDLSHHIHHGMPHFIELLMNILVLIGTIFKIIWEMFYGRISLKVAFYTSDLITTMSTCVRTPRKPKLYVAMADASLHLLLQVKQGQ